MFFGTQIEATFYLATWTKRRIVLKVSPISPPGKVRGWHDPLQCNDCPGPGPGTSDTWHRDAATLIANYGDNGWGWTAGTGVTSIWSFKWVIYPLLLFIITYHTRWWWWKQKVMYSLLCSSSVPSPICHRDLSQPSELCPPRLMAGRSKIVKLCHVVYYRQTCKTCLTMFSLVCAQHLRLKRML